jgi:tRNA-dihydrouridine synthase B
MVPLIPFFQAGLAGYSDAAMRIVAREHGCPYAVTEAMLDEAILDPRFGVTLETIFPLAGRDEAAGLDQPLAAQIMGSDGGRMAEAALALLEMGRASGLPQGGFQTIDINLACPVKKVARKRRGGHWLGDPDGAVFILQQVRSSVPAGIPCTVKLRRGSDDSAEARAAFFRIYDAAYALGFAWTTVHARSVEQKYVGSSRWAFLRELRERNPERKFFGSGDVFEAKDVLDMIRKTGVSGVSVARGCIGNPWIFHQARAMLAGEEARKPSIAEQRDVLSRHLLLSSLIHGEDRAPVLMRKFALRFAQHHPDGPALKNAFVRAATLGEWQAILDRHYRSAELDLQYPQEPEPGIA